MTDGNEDRDEQLITYTCPECNCEFVRREDEPEVCKCSECGCDSVEQRTNVEQGGCPCCS